MQHSTLLKAILCRQQMLIGWHVYLYICWFPALEYISSAGIDGHICITYPQCNGTGKEHFVRQHKVVLAVLPTEKFRKKVAIKSF